MTPLDMHDRLVELHAELTRRSAEHRRICASSAPTASSIGLARWRIAEVSRHRMELLTGTILPLVLDDRRAAADTRLDRLRSETTAYRMAVSTYVNRWTTTAILADWSGYGKEAVAFRAMVAARLDDERRVLLPLLRRAGAGSAMGRANPPRVA